MNILTTTKEAILASNHYGITVQECVDALSILNGTYNLKRPIKTKDNKRILLTINEGLEILRTYGKNVCDLPKKKVEEYLMVIRL